MIMGDRARQRVNISLNAVRTIAAFLVVISHLRALFFVDFSDAESKSVLVQAVYLAGSLGHPAVIVFFVLSGYWVGGATTRSVSAGSFSWSRYGIARLSRLWLVLAPAIILTQLLDRLGSEVNGSSMVYSGSPDYHTVIPADGPVPTLGVAETLGNLFFVQSIHVPTLGTNSPLWSLAYEFWYYALFPAILVALSRRFETRSRIASGIFVVVGGIVAGPDVLLMFPAWLLGAGVGWQQERVAARVFAIKLRSLALARMASVSSVVFTSIAVVAFGSRVHGLELIVALPAAAMVALFSVKPSRSFVLKPLSSAAEWSYSLYAIHVPVLAFLASFIVPASEARWQVTGASAVGFVAVLSVVAASAYGMSLVTETHTKRLRDGLIKRLSASKAIATTISGR
ncbi:MULTISPECIES: acyltransferase [unclassified Arthrobacter]|uniref:acyltransferase family protein n=1 Tax=unclassified Arthrobacter TaxID=235627 RepID=UPI001C8470DB|nr:acyltransferase [Arthrobacter sp. MAHUQ-56]MBX7444922.1 acyltransferase [Arthrobacter sp. MAHUQ-56]